MEIRRAPNEPKRLQTLKEPTTGSAYHPEKNQKIIKTFQGMGLRATEKQCLYPKNAPKNAPTISLIDSPSPKIVQYPKRPNLSQHHSIAKL